MNQSLEDLWKNNIRFEISIHYPSVWMNDSVPVTIHNLITTLVFMLLTKHVTFYHGP